MLGRLSSSSLRAVSWRRSVKECEKWRRKSSVCDTRWKNAHDTATATTTTTTCYSTSTILWNPPPDDGREALKTKDERFRELGIHNDRVVAPSKSSNNPVQNHHRRHQQRKRPSSLARHVRRPANSTSVRVKSVHAAKTIDVVAVLSKVFGVSSANPPVRHMFGKTSVVVHLPPAHESDPHGQFVAVFRFGSVVFFNISPRKAGRLLESIKQHG